LPFEVALVLSEIFSEICPKAPKCIFSELEIKNNADAIMVAKARVLLSIFMQYSTFLYII
jgi:hypothetical protein